MCDKGTWVSQIRANTAVRGFFRLELDHHAKPQLSDASGCIPLTTQQPIDLKSCIGRVNWISGHALEQQVQVMAALPAIRWTGNPFALVDPSLPGSLVAAALCRHVQQIRQPEVRQLLDQFFCDQSVMKLFMTAPASLRHHHAFPGGLAIHTCEVMDMAHRMASDLSPEEHALVMAACLLHDAGKIYEYTSNHHCLTPRGRLLGHEVTLLELLAPIADRIWSRGHPHRLLLVHLLTAKPAPQWTGIRHPRSQLVSIVRFADSWSADANHKFQKPSLKRVFHIKTAHLEQ